MRILKAFHWMIWAAVLRDNKEHLYSYTSVQESREVTTEDPETGEETTTTETWIIYTIRYNGESYLADHVFALTDEQKELASDYASNLSTFWVMGCSRT